MDLDLHLRNVLVRLPFTFEELSVKEFREKFGQPELIPIARIDEKPLTSNVPARAVVPLYLGKKSSRIYLGRRTRPNSQRLWRGVLPRHGAASGQELQYSSGQASARGFF